MILQRVTPVTHSVGNCLKRVIVIVASVIVFQNPMSKQNMIGKLPLACCLWWHEGKMHPGDAAHDLASGCISVPKLCDCGKSMLCDCGKSM